MFNGRRQPSHGGTSRMMREYQVRICERLGVKFLGPTRQSLHIFDLRVVSAIPPIATGSPCCGNRRFGAITGHSIKCRCATIGGGAV